MDHRSVSVFLFTSSPSAVAVTPGVSDTADAPADTVPNGVYGTLTSACVCLRMWTWLIICFLWGSEKRSLLFVFVRLWLKALFLSSLFRALLWKWFLVGLFIYLSFDWLSWSFSIVSGWSMCVSCIKQSIIYFLGQYQGLHVAFGDNWFSLFDRFLGFHLSSSNS